MSTDADTPKAAKRRHHIEKRSSETSPVWRRAWFWLFAGVLLLVTLPAVPAAWHILGPDDKEPEKVLTPEFGPVPDNSEALAKALPGSPTDAFLDIASMREKGRRLSSLSAKFADPDIRNGKRYDATITPAFLEEVARIEALYMGGFIDAESPCRPEDIAVVDGLIRAKLADARTRLDARSLVMHHRERLLLARSLVFAVSTPEDFLAALRHERDVLAEIRFDADLLATDPAALKIILPALAAHAAAPDVALTKRLALNFDARLDVEPDAGLLAMRDKSPAPADAARFERIARFARKPNLHRRDVSAMLANFGDILAKPTYADAGRSLLKPAPDGEISLASLFLRDRVFQKLGGDAATRYFFPAQPDEGGALDFFLKFDAFTESRDILGVAYLMHRRAELLTLLAHFDRTRFDAGATAYHLALRYRHALAGGKWPKDTEGLFDGLLGTYPLDPFTDEPVAYSRKNLTLHSPGADGVDKNGLDEPEFASELAELWEPTIPLETGGETNPAAFGIKR